ncbi:Golgi antiapoptotic protein [Fasciola gigantica]|uniref:Golgi antiapoptotic protein n=1 Tax=Fasciola gigantica TaxID=46835 RepID=A0A504Z8X9_FASGI|nr:Golgi antiapoptotic protein [Fasciola gigantica]
MNAAFFTDVETGHPLEKDFAYKNNVAQAQISIRMGFLRKVYGILFAQLSITVLCAGAMFLFRDELLRAVQLSSALPLITFIGSIGFLVALMFKKHQTPLNYLLLLGFTICESLLIGFVVLAYSARVVLQAFALTTAVTFCLMAYAMQSKHDFSQWGAGLFAGLLVLILAAPLNFFIGSSVFEFSIAAGGSVLFCLLIVYDTHRIMHYCSAEDYVVACVDLYLDILNLFVYLLRVLRSMDNQ